MLVATSITEVIFDITCILISEKLSHIDIVSLNYSRLRRLHPRIMKEYTSVRKKYSYLQPFSSENQEKNCTKLTNSCRSPYAARCWSRTVTERVRGIWQHFSIQHWRIRTHPKYSTRRKRTATLTETLKLQINEHLRPFWKLFSFNFQF